MFWNRIKELEKENKELKNLLIKKEQTKLVFWVIEAPSNEDFESIWQNKEVIKSIIKYLTHKIVIRMDMLRNTEQWDYLKKVWYLDALNDITLFFHNYIWEKHSKKEYTWQNLK